MEQRIFGFALLALAGNLACAASEVAPGAALASPEVQIVSGHASYLERMALPPTALLTVRIEDVSRADAAAKLVAELSRPVGRDQVPLAFELTVPKVQIEPGHRYALRATIHLEGQLRFTTTQHYPVLTDGTAGPLAVRLHAVNPQSTAPSAGASAPTPSQHAQQILRNFGLSLPQTFTGVLPCADCAGIAHTLTLLPDGLYQLRLSYLGKPGAPFVEQGQWSISQAAAGTGPYQLKLLNAAQEANYFLLQPPKLDREIEASLRQLDRQARPFKSSANLWLRPTATVDPVDAL
ncbi:YbaY family lipoprotein [Paucibacter sp. B2R-40]|uniref:YbaY family lipoprotein n=1 Tax=Paucibacter sp. B2R-40 TaxID=2893554 RepID=UPI0021E40958|nr:YbaY family lipoprotein [Paucibacter sp. B2R-40]MCV2355846.1 YbaY family lipoprotein [Paucibacter sp. B2R-40]